MTQLTPADEIAKLRRDVDVLTGLVVGLISMTEMRTRVAVRNYDAVSGARGTDIHTVALTELATQQAQVLHLENERGAGFHGDTLLGFDTLLDRLNSAIGDYAMPVMTETKLAA